MNFRFRIWILLFCFTLSEGEQKKPGSRKKFCPKGCECKRNSPGFRADCISLGLNTIPNSFDEHPSWTYIDLSRNYIKTIEENSLKPFLIIETLDLSGNEISTIHPSSFRGLQRLSFLNLRGNHITTIPSRLFSDSLNIHRLYLDTNSIGNLTAEAFVGLHNLEYLLLDNNELKTIPVEALRQTPRLQVLSLTVNQIESIPDGAFEMLSELSVLNLRENYIKEIGDNAMRQIVLCYSLDLSFNLMTEYPKTVMDLAHLTELFINDNRIENLPDRAFARQSDLTTLFFQNNLWTSVGRWTFTNLRNIESLELLNISEQEYFPDLSGCSNLRTLSVTGGRIYTVPQNLCGPETQLRTLDVSNNKLYNLTGISNCFNLETLNAAGNSFSALEKEEMENLTTLEDLNLSNNEISFLSDDSFENTNLKTLNLAENPFSFLPVKGLSYLTTLNISDCPNLLYLPPLELMEDLKRVEATYEYHCCQINRKGRQEEGKGQSKDNMSSISCLPEPGPLTPCDNLLNPMAVRILLWIVLIVSVVLNISIIFFNVVTRCISAYKQLHLDQSSREEEEDNEDKKCNSGIPSGGLQSRSAGTFEISLCHLALADLIASIYVAIILNYDAQTREDFAQSGSWWQQSISCKTAGFCLVMGLQMGFFTVLIASIERYLSTMFPLNPEKHFGKTVMCLTLCASWIIAIATAVVTLYSGNERTLDYFDNPFPTNNGATCLPWSTDFPYVAILVGAHVLACTVVIFLCAFMYCARRKQSWLSTQKHTRCQITLTVACNVIFLLPLALIGLLASAVATYPSSIQPWLSPQNSATMHFVYDTTELNVELLLTAVMLLISVRLLLNPVLYIGFSEKYCKECVKLIKALVCRKRKRRYREDASDDEDDDNAASRMIATELACPEGATFSPLDNYAILQRVPLHLIPRTEDDFSEEREFYERQICPPGCYAYKDANYPPEMDEEESIVEENDPMLQDCHHHDEPQSFDEDVATGSNWPDNHQKITVYPDYRSDPFRDSNQFEASKSYNYPRTSDPLPSSQKAMFWNVKPSKDDIHDNDVPGPSQPDTSLATRRRTRPKYWSAVVQEAKKRLPPLTLQKYLNENQTVCTVGGQILMQSCESSTSKDSGIQSEPDFGAGVACSSGCSTLSRAGRGKISNENTVPMILMSSQLGGHYTLQPAEQRVNNSSRCVNDYKAMRSNGQCHNNFFILSPTNVNTNKRGKLKTETVL